MSASSLGGAPRPATVRVCPECERTMTTRRCAQCDAATIPESVLRPQRDELIGTTLQNQYKIVAELGRGGMGTVYRGTQLTIDRAVAIKVISKGFAGDLDSIRRFRREARITSKLTHPNTIRVFDFGLTEAGQVFLVMELLQGQELGEQLASSGPLPLDQAIDICVQVLGALEEAHAAGVVHRDLKPANIFMQRVGGRDIAKVMDFGIAKGGAEHSQMTKTGAMIGTPAYMSPEQSRGERVGPATDLYAMGIIFYELLTGQVPFRAETPVATLFMHVANTPPRLAESQVDLPNLQAVQATLDRFLSKDIGDRPANAREAAMQLQALRPRSTAGRASPHPGTHTSQTVIATLDRGAVSPLNGVGAVRQGAAAAELTGSRQRKLALMVLAAAAAMLLLVALGAGGIWWWMAHRADVATPSASGAAAAPAGATRSVSDRHKLAAQVPTKQTKTTKRTRPGGATATRTEPANRPKNQPTSAAGPAKLADAKSAENAKNAKNAKRVLIRSTPKGATVWEGERSLGVAPLRLPSPPDGPARRLELKLKGHTPVPLTVRAGQTGELVVVMPRKPTKTATKPKRAHATGKRRPGRDKAHAAPKQNTNGQPFMVE